MREISSAAAWAGELREHGDKGMTDLFTSTGLLLRVLLLSPGAACVLRFRKERKKKSKHPGTIMQFWAAVKSRRLAFFHKNALGV